MIKEDAFSGNHILTLCLDFNIKLGTSLQLFVGLAQHLNLISRKGIGFYHDVASRSTDTVKIKRVQMGNSPAAVVFP